MFDTVGFPVTRLARVAVGPIRLGDLKPGRRRHLQSDEVQSLLDDLAHVHRRVFYSRPAPTD